MDLIDLDHDDLRRGSRGWERLAGSLDDAARRLRTADCAGLPPDLAGAAEAFTGTWAGMTGDASERAGRLALAVRKVSDDFEAIDNLAYGSINAAGAGLLGSEAPGDR